MDVPRKFKRGDHVLNVAKPEQMLIVVVLCRPEPLALEEDADWEIPLRCKGANSRRSHVFEFA